MLMRFAYHYLTHNYIHFSLERKPLFCYIMESLSLSILRRCEVYTLSFLFNIAFYDNLFRQLSNQRRHSCATRPNRELQNFRKHSNQPDPLRQKSTHPWLFNCYYLNANRKRKYISFLSKIKGNRHLVPGH
jgi:hypothetical protein